ncbi:hypothetical protein [Mycobacterium branderi]|nr:hypothetical protein [Mycobacterium branderi]MCV7233146.1 hypothetical protein [Mycobacterium branderi]
MQRLSGLDASFPYLETSTTPLHELELRVKGIPEFGRALDELLAAKPRR